MFKELLLNAQDIGGVFKTDPVTDDHLFAVQDRLEKMGLQLPDEYSDFLFTTDGLFWAGLEFFGANPSGDKKNGYNITGLAEQNMLYQALNKGTDKVFIGRTDEENFVYNPVKDVYEIVDEFSGELVKEFAHFEEMFDYLIKEQMEIIQNYVGFNEDTLVDETEEDF